MPRVLVDLLSLTGTKGGMETYTRELYQSMSDVAPEYEFVGFASSEGFQLDHDWFPGEMIDSGISGENRFAWARGEIFSVARAADRLNVDLVHCPASLGPRRTKMPTVLTLHDVFYWSHPELMTTPFYTRPVKWIERAAATNAAHVITDSAVSRDEILRFLRLDPAKLHVVHLAGVGSSVAARERQVEDPPFLLATGNRRPHKNWDGLIRALALVDEAVRPRLVITGSHGEDPLQPVVAELGLQRWVELRGWVDATQLADLYSRATALAMPSLLEGFSLTVLEAMGAGVPVLLSDIEVHREVGGSAAEFFDPKDDGDIARAIVRVVTDRDHAEDLARRGSDHAASFSWGKCAQETLSVFERALTADQ
jgi:alpha-1,3-rhamnosyl/mannosyltransferase